MAPSAIVSDDSVVPISPSKGVPSNGSRETSLEAYCFGPNKLPGIPTHPSFASHRLWALSHMAAVFRSWSREGYTEGMSGHISVRDPEFPDLFWMNPLAIHFGLLKASDMLLLSDNPADGEVILAGNARNKPANKAGWAIHGALHRRRPDVNAACHAHTIYGKAWSACGGRGLEMLNQDVCTFYGESLKVYDNYGGVAVGASLGEGEEIADAMGAEGKGCILVNHGLLTVGKTVDEAGFLFGLLERSCKIQIEVEKVMSAGNVKRIIGDREAEFNYGIQSVPDVLYWEFQPTYDYEEAMSHDDLKDLQEEDLRIKF